VCWKLWEVVKCVGNCGRWLSVLETVGGGYVCWKLWKVVT
jgi:hypothetical protein